MKKKELLKQSKKLAAVITAVALMDTPVVYAAEGTSIENHQEAETSNETVSTVEESEKPLEEKTPSEEETTEEGEKQTEEEKTSEEETTEE